MCLHHQFNSNNHPGYHSSTIRHTAKLPCAMSDYQQDCDFEFHTRGENPHAERSTTSSQVEETHGTTDKWWIWDNSMNHWHDDDNLRDTNNIHDTPDPYDPYDPYTLYDHLTHMHHINTYFDVLDRTHIYHISRLIHTHHITHIYLKTH